MDKIRRFIYLPVIYHSAVFLAMIVVLAMKINVSLLVLLDWCGVLLSPILLAILSVAHAIVHEGKVFDYLKDCVISLCAVSIVRVVLYSVFSLGILPVAAMCALISFGVFFIWDCVFALTDKIMKKKPLQRNMYKKNKK
ncbi:MAG: hypothetical protein ACI3XA_06410 [Clostridia bacterium]